MGFSIGEVNDKLRKVVKLPESGLDVQIRRVWQLDFVGVGELPVPVDGEENLESPPKKTPEEIDNILSRARHIIIIGSVKPCFSDDCAEAARIQAAYVRELSQNDFWFLVEEILQYSGLKKEVKADADAFRADAIGDNGKGAGAGIRKAPDGDTAPGAVGILPEHGDHVSAGDQEVAAVKRKGQG